MVLGGGGKFSFFTVTMITHWRMHKQPQGMCQDKEGSIQILMGHAGPTIRQCSESTMEGEMQVLGPGPLGGRLN